MNPASTSAPPAPVTHDGFHRCAVGEPHCRQVVSTTMLMCRRHWNMVPRALQVALWKSFRRAPEGGPLLSVAYRTARTKCVEAVHVALGEIAAEHTADAIQRDQQQRMPL